MIVCVTAVMPKTVKAAEAYAALSNDNTTLTFYYDDEKNSRYGMDIGPFEDRKQRGWYDYAKIITTVEFDVSFANMTELTSTAFWFSSFQKLATIIGIENLKTSNVTDMSAMFHECLSLISLDVRGFDTRNVINMEGMFAECESLPSIDLRNFDTRNVENMGYMFAECDVIQSIDLSSFNTEKVTTMAGMFGHCNEALKVLDLSSFNTSNVTDMRKMFYNSPLLTTVYVSAEWSTAKVEKGNEVFSNCNSIVGGSGTTWDENHTDYTYAHIDGGASNPGYLTLKTGDIPDINTDKVEAYAALSNDNTTLTFYYDNQKSSRNGMYIGPFHGSKEEIGWYDCRYEITKIVFDTSFHNNDTLSCTAYWFSYLTNLEGIEGLDNLKTDNVTNMECMFAHCKKIKNLDLHNLKTHNVTNMGLMFNGCIGLEKLNISSFNTTNVTNMYSMFGDCNSLEDVDVSCFNTSKVLSMAYMFYGCSSLTTLDLSNFDTSNVRTMIYMFNKCGNLKNLDIRSFKTSNVRYMSSMFDGCSSITDIDISGFTLDNITTLGNMFKDCYSLKNITLTKLSTQWAVDLQSMFEGCSQLSMIDLSCFETSKVTSMGRMFRGCSSLRTIYVSESWSVDKITYGTNMFENCSGLEGGMGTKYDPTHTDHTYAHIDGGASNPGYLTYKEAGNPTGIKSIRETDNKKAGYYNLNGIKLLGNPDKGIYIKDGKKYMK